MSSAVAPILDSPGLVRYGLPQRVYAASPAAGADFSASMPGQFFTRLLSVHVKLVTAADVAAREVVVSYEDAGGKRFALAGINTTVAASLTAYYEFNAFQPEAVATVDGSALVPLSPLLLMPTDVFKIHVVNIAATDQLSEVRYVLEQFYTTDAARAPAPRAAL